MGGGATDQCLEGNPYPVQLYHENDDGCAAVANARKKYKSHRAVRLATNGNLLEHMPQ